MDLVDALLGGVEEDDGHERPVATQQCGRLSVNLAARMAHHAAPDRDLGVGIEAHLSFGGAVQRRQPLAAREHVPEACGTRRDEKKHKDAFGAALAELEGRVAAVR